MAARYFRNSTLEVAESEVHYSAILVGKNTQSISVVTNNDRDSHNPVSTGNNNLMQITQIIDNILA